MLKKFKSIFNKKEEKLPPIEVLFDAKLNSYEELVDLFPEAAYPHAEHQNALEVLHNRRRSVMGEKINSNKDNVVPVVAIFRENKKLNIPVLTIYKEGEVTKLRVFAAWKDREGKIMTDNTTFFQDFDISETRARQLVEDYNSSRGSSPEQGY
jgi:hypothetical protein